MANNSFFSGRIPPELHQSVKKHCDESGKTQTQVLIEALSNYLNIPAKNRDSKSDEVTREMYNLLLERIEILEDKLSDNNVINNDNKIIVDENFKLLVKENVNELLTKEEEQNEKYDNNGYERNNDDADINNLSNQTLQAYRNIDSKKLSEITDLDISERNNLKNQAVNKAKKQGYKINENFKFNQPIKMTFRRGIKVEGNEYILLCEGIEIYKKPIWSLVPDDNISYQPNILQNND